MPNSLSEIKEIKKIAVLTSGGDSPGMNAAIRAVVRSAIFKNLSVAGVMNGFSGLLNNEFIELHSHSVSKIISRGGTMLKSSRCPEFHHKDGRLLAVKNMRDNHIDALVVLGGDGSFRGADLLGKEFEFPVVGAPCTIDNDIYGTDYTIGFDTALNTAVTAIDKIRDTADSHNMLFFVEVMGRHSGFIALHTAIATGAEATLLPETPTSIEKLCKYLGSERRKNKTSGIIIVAEGDQEGGAEEIAQKVKKKLPGYETRVTTLGHVQRGGPPSCNDRILASLMGYECVISLLAGKYGIMVGRLHRETVYIPFEEAYSRHDEIEKNWIGISQIISI
jgi:6-phosphofructokinase 1